MSRTTHEYIEEQWTQLLLLPPDILCVRHTVWIERGREDLQVGVEVYQHHEDRPVLIEVGPQHSDEAQIARIGSDLSRLLSRACKTVYGF